MHEKAKLSYKIIKEKIIVRLLKVARENFRHKEKLQFPRRKEKQRFIFRFHSTSENSLHKNYFLKLLCAFRVR
jgi:hypothetical protein